MIIRKTPEEIEKIAAAGDVLVRTLRLLERLVRPGVTTDELDAAAEKFIRSQGGVPTFKGYRGFPASICASPNSMIVHGIPGPYALERGDLISLDVGVTLDGWVADAARTLLGRAGRARSSQPARGHERGAVRRHRAVRRRQPPRRRLARDPDERRGATGSRSCARSSGTASAATMHEDPQIPNFGEPGTGPRLLEGMVLAIEPMTTAGGPSVRAGNDGWSIYSQDGSLTAHFEFTVAITAAGPRVLTPWHLADGEGAAVGNISGRARVG